MAEAPGRRPLRIVIIGGGMTGLGAARVLEQARAADEAVDWQLYEADPRFGGKVHTVRRDGFVVEGGPDSAIIEKPWPIRLARELGIGDRLQDSNEDIRRSFVYARGALHELPEGLILMVPTRMVPFALSGLMSWPGKLRMGFDLVLPRGGAALNGEEADESLGDFVRRRLGREALERIAEPIVAGIHAGDPERMSVRATFPMFLDMERTHRSLIVAMLQRRRARQKAAAQQAAAGAAPAPLDRRPALLLLLVPHRPAGPQRRRGGLAAARAPARRRGRHGPHAGAAGRGLRRGAGRRRACGRRRRSAGRTGLGRRRAVARGGARACRELSSIDYVTTATVSVAYRADQVGARPRGLRLRGAARRGPAGDGHHLELQQVRRPGPGRARLLRSFLGAPAWRPRPSSTTTR